MAVFLPEVGVVRVGFPIILMNAIINATQSEHLRFVHFHI